MQVMHGLNIGYWEPERHDEIHAQNRHAVFEQVNILSIQNFNLTEITILQSEESKWTMLAQLFIFFVFPLNADTFFLFPLFCKLNQLPWSLMLSCGHWFGNWSFYIDFCFSLLRLVFGTTRSCRDESIGSSTYYQCSVPMQWYSVEYLLTLLLM